MADYIEVCEKAVRRAGALLLDRIGRVSVRAKGRADLVTDADLASQELVRQTICEAFPDHFLLGEEDSPESAPLGGASAYRWIVDPLDGTTNYVHQVPFFGVSLALEHAGQLLVGAVYDPSADACFTGVRGQGAYCNGVRLRTSTVTSLADALVSVGFPAEVARDSPDLRLFNEAVLLCQSMRRTGSLALNLAYLAAGRFDVVWSWNARVWDVAAGILLIREAGGLATSIDGNDFPLAHGPFLATANEALHEQMVALVRRVGLATG
jgi:myo-inositol-1(or 4)-monophosphatase